MMKARRQARRTAAQPVDAFTPVPAPELADGPVYERSPDAASFRWALDLDHGTAAS